MLYTPAQNETALDIATRLTLSPAYASAILDVNEIYADVSDSGEIQPYSITSPIAWFGRLNIPDDWLKPGASTTSSASTVSSNWVIIAIAVAVAFLVGQPEPSRSKRR